jgi:hypothetical protein
MTLGRFTALVVVTAVAVPRLTHAQTISPTGGEVPTAVAADVSSIDSIITALYAVISGPAGQKRNWDRFRSLHLPEARLIPTGFAQGSDRARARLMSVEDYVTSSGPSLEERGFFEIEVNRVTEQFENIAHVFSTYESRWAPDDAAPFQRGINSIQLMWDGERWWIANIMWRGVGPDVVLPERYLNN